MRRGFTLLEIIIVIIIIGVLATLGFTQYGRMVERSRGAEARAIAGDIRKFAAAYRIEYGSLIAGPGFDVTRANIGTAADQIPSACRASHYFSYALNPAPTADTVSVTATRCAAGGKVPNWSGAGAAPTYTLVANLNTGVDTAGGTGSY